MGSGIVRRYGFIGVDVTFLEGSVSVEVDLRSQKLKLCPIALSSAA